MIGIKNKRKRIPKGSQKWTIQRNLQYRTHKMTTNKTKTQHTIYVGNIYTHAHTNIDILFDMHDEVFE